jgi:hypothetical protein
MTRPDTADDAGVLAGAVASMAASMLGLAGRCAEQGAEGVAWVMDRASDPDDLPGPGFWAGVLALAGLVTTGDVAGDAMEDHAAGWRAMAGPGRSPGGEEERT